MMEIFIANVAGTPCFAVVGRLEESEENFRSRFIYTFGAFLKGLASATLYFGYAVKKVRILLAELPYNYNCLGNATIEGYDLFLNKKNRILQYNCIAFAVIYHEHAHWVDLKRRGKIRSLERKPVEKILSNMKDPAHYSEWLYDEYRANKLLPLKTLRNLKLVAAANLLGCQNADEFFERMERIYPSFVVAQVINSFENLVYCYLPIYLCEPKEQQGKFLHDLLNASKPCYKKWLSTCFNVVKGKPVYKQRFPKEEILLLIAGRQISSKEKYWFNIDIFPLPMKLAGVKPTIEYTREQREAT